MPLLLAAAGACSHSDSSGEEQSNDSIATVSAASPSSLELPLPVIPDSISTQNGRVDYILTHFWSPMDWTDTVRSLNTDFIEQNFVNYVTFFNIAQQESVQKSVTALLKKVSSHTPAMKLLMETAEKYLYEPDSPMLNEEYFETFLRAASTAGAQDEYERERSKFLLAEIAKNRRGTIASDFTFTDPSGHNNTLHGICKKSQLTLVMFYEPDCETCAGTIASLSSDSDIAKLIADRKLGILTIYPGNDNGLWQEKQRMIPATWLNGIASGQEFASRELYSFRAMPTLYLLDSSARVIAKDLPLLCPPALLSKHTVP